MAKQVTNVFVDVTLASSKTVAAYKAQHQKHFPRNAIASFRVGKSAYLKVPYAAGETKALGLTREQWDTMTSGNLVSTSPKF